MKRIEFLEKAHNKHGYKYNYVDLSDKIILSDKIKIEYILLIFFHFREKRLINA